MWCSDIIISKITLSIPVTVIVDIESGRSEIFYE